MLTHFASQFEATPSITKELMPGTKISLYEIQNYNI